MLFSRTRARAHTHTCTHTAYQADLPALSTSPQSPPLYPTRRPQPPPALNPTRRPKPIRRPPHPLPPSQVPRPRARRSRPRRWRRFTRRAGGAGEERQRDAWGGHWRCSAVWAGKLASTEYLCKHIRRPMSPPDWVGISELAGGGEEGGRRASKLAALTRQYPDKDCCILNTKSISTVSAGSVGRHLWAPAGGYPRSAHAMHGAVDRCRLRSHDGSISSY